jgi:hypothetical protein
MRKRYIALFVLACAGIVIATMQLTHKDDGPVFRGHPLRYWLLADQKHPGAEGTHDAVKNAGTNALPYLLRWIRYEAPPWKARVLQFLGSALLRTTVSHRELLANGARDAFSSLGTNAVSAVPELTALARNADAPQAALRAMVALRGIGTNGLTPLISVASDCPYPLRPMALACLALTLTDSGGADVVGPAMVQCLGDMPDPGVLGLAIRWLGDTHYSPNTSVKALTNCLARPGQSHSVRAGALSALAKYGADATAALPAITNALTDPDGLVRESASNAIQKITSPPPTQAPPP